MPHQIPESYIKNIALRLPEDFKLINTPYREDDDEDGGDPPVVSTQQFIGHQEDMDKFVKYLESGYGVFLVTGFRGMGKTSFVNKVINRFKENTKEKNRTSVLEKPFKTLVVRLTLAQNSPKELDILRLMTSSAFDKYDNYLYKIKDKKRDLRVQKYSSLFNHISVGVFLLLFIPFLLIKWPLEVSSYLSNPLGSNTTVLKGLAVLKMFSYSLLIACFGYLLFYVARLMYIAYRRNRDKERKDRGGFTRLKILNDRCYAALTHEESKGESVNFMNKFFSYISSANEKKVRQYPIAGAKEIEYELRQILKEAQRDHIKFLFVFDELDKVDPATDITFLYDLAEGSEHPKNEFLQQTDYRNRKQAVINVIAGLKISLLLLRPISSLSLAGRCSTPPWRIFPTGNRRSAACSPMCLILIAC